MIYIVDNFIEKEFFEIINAHLDKGQFEKIKAGDKDFHSQHSN